MILELLRVNKYYGNLHALIDLDLTLEKGQVLGLLGVNGAGKSTLIKILTAYHYADSGSVRIFGHDMYSQSQKIVQNIGYLPEKLTLYSELTVHEFLRFAAEAKEVEKPQKAIDEMVSTLQLEKVFHKSLSTLSKGFRQRVGLAQAMLAKPKLLVLDEPINGLDPSQVLEFRSYLQSIQKDVSIVFSSHILSEIEALSDHVVVIHQGRKVMEGTVSELTERQGQSAKIHINFIHEKRLTEKINAEKSLFTVLSLEPQIDQNTISVSLQLKGKTQAEDVFDWIKQENFRLTSFVPEKAHLESIFLSLEKEPSRSKTQGVAV